MSILSEYPEVSLSEVISFNFNWFHYKYSCQNKQKHQTFSSFVTKKTKFGGLIFLSDESDFYKSDWGDVEIHV